MKTTQYQTCYALSEAMCRAAYAGLVIAILSGWNATAATRYVWQDSPNTTPPFDSWAKAATNIQDAVDAAQPGDLVLVTNGVYATGGKVVHSFMMNRVLIDKAVTVESLMGPELTVIEGAPALGGGIGDGAVRCVYLGTNAVLSGFTLTNGHTHEYGTPDENTWGGGAWCDSSAVVTNCVITGNSAVRGGGAYGGILRNCALIGNSAQNGGGAYDGTLYNCILNDNSAEQLGGGACSGVLHNCALTGNSATWGGGYAVNIGYFGGTLNNCTLTDNSALYVGGGVYGGALENCIAYFNSAPAGANYAHYFSWTFVVPATFNHSCTTPLPFGGIENIDEDPQLATLTHLSAFSPCIGTGSSTHASGVDIDGQPWANPPCMGADQLAIGEATGPLSMEISLDYTNVAPGFTLNLGAQNQGTILTSVWDFDDGTFVTNRAVVTHAWAEPGTYAVRLTGYNHSFPSGLSATVQVEVTEQTYYVNQANPTPVFPYTSWETAATNIQDAIAAKMTAGSLVLVTNGVYASGSVMTKGTNRIALAYPVEVRSVNGPQVTVVEGAAGIRCAYVGADAILSGFSLTKGNASEGGGAWCEKSALLTNCIITGNAAVWLGDGSGVGVGGGVFGGTLSTCTVTSNSAWGGGGVWDSTLYNCVLFANSATDSGGGSMWGTLFNCILNGNSAGTGGGARDSILYNCTVTANSATSYGGGAYGGNLNNCIVYFNTGGNYDGAINISYSCTTPLPYYGTNNITNAPVFVDLAAGDLHLRYGSPGIDAGTNLTAILTNDLDGNPRPLDGDGDGIAAFDMGAYEFDARSIIPSDWFTGHGLDPADPQVVSGNPDHDAFTTFQEWLADTDPTNALSFFHIEAISKSSPPMVTLQSSSNRIYTLWSTPQLAPPTWSPVPGAEAIPGTGGPLTLSDPTNAPQQFYRVQVNLP